MMRTMITNNLIAFASPDHPDVFRIMFTTDAPDVALEKLSTESPAPIIIHLTKEVEVNPRSLAGWSGLLNKFKPAHPNSKWLLMEPHEVQWIFDVNPDMANPPPFLEHMPTDEGRSQSMEPEIKESRDTGSEEESVGVSAGIKVPLNVTCNDPTARGYLRNLWECFPDGTWIWHARPAYACHLNNTSVMHPTGWYGRYDAVDNTIVCDADGKKYSTIGAFANAHYDLHGYEKQNGWSTCKYLTNGEWKDVGSIKASA